MGISVLSGHEKRQFMANSITSVGIVIGHVSAIPTTRHGSYRGGPRVHLRIEYKTQDGLPLSFVSTLSFNRDEHPVNSRIELIYDNYDHTNVKLQHYYKDQGFGPQLLPLGFLTLLIGLIFLYRFRNVDSIRHDT